MTARTALSVAGLDAGLGDLDILNGVNLRVPFGEVHALMGPNGSGKSTFCHALAGKPGYRVAGSATVDGTDLGGLDVDERAQAGLMCAFQYPVEVPGLELSVFLEEAAGARGMDGEEARARMAEEAQRFGMEEFLDRSVNGGLSGGETKTSEVFQAAVLRPKVLLLDEIDSGLDIDAVRKVAGAVSEMRGPETAIVMITHYNRILNYVRPDRVHIMMEGRIVDSGGPELADDLEEGGYEKVRARLGLQAPAASEPAPRKASDFFTDTPFDA